MKFTDFKKITEDGKEFSAYLFVGEDAYFRNRGLALLKKTFLSEPSLNLVNYEGDAFSISDMVASLNSFPFMSRKRLTVVREFYPKAEQLKKGELKAYLEAPVAEGMLIILNEKPCEPLKKFESVCVVDCGKQEPSLLVRWITGECRNNGVSIDAETAKILCDFCLADMTRIETELRKLIDYVGKGGKITEKELSALVVEDNEFKVYEMTEYIANKKFDLALKVINDMMSRGETSQRIILSVYNYYRRLLHAAISGKNAAQLALSLGIKEYPAKRLIEQASRFRKRALKKAVDLLTDADYNIKSGKIDGDEAMWLSVFFIMTEK